MFVVQSVSSWSWHGLSHVVVQTQYGTAGLIYWMCLQAVMVDKPKERGSSRSSPMDTMGYSPSGMPAGLTM